MAQVAYHKKHNDHTQHKYVPRRPCDGNVFSVVRDNWKKFEMQATTSDKSPARYISKEFEEFLKCGILAHGFVRLKCDSCDENRIVPLSCKRRGFCPSCCGRRMNEGSAFLVDNVFPRVPIRQWVLSFPMPVRFWMARNPKLITQALEIFHRVIRTHYKSQYKNSVKNIEPGFEILTGAVTVVQRFGSALNLNIHFHALVLDGVFVVNEVNGKKVATFIPATKPTREEFLDVTQKIQIRMLRALQRLGLVQKLEAESGGDGIQNDDSIEAICQGASVQYRLAMGSAAGARIRKIGSLGFLGEEPILESDLSAIIGGYSLHANTFIHKNNRAELERLCRYILRPPIAEERLEVRGDKVIYKLKSQWRDGTKAVLFSGTEFIEKIVALIPQPRIHGTRFHGILAPHSAFRSLVVPKREKTVQSEPTEENSEPKSDPTRLRWAELLRRVFGVDLEKCPCGGKLKFIAAVMDRDSIKKILHHMNIPYFIPEFAPP